MSSNGLIDRLADKLAGGRYMGLLENRRRMVITTIWLSTVSILNLLVTGAVLFVLDEPNAGWAAMAGTVAYLASVPYFLATGNNVRAAGWVLIVSYVNNVAVHVILGGFANSGGYLAWGIIVCAYAVIVQSRRFTVTLTALYVAAAVVLVFLESSLSAGRVDPEPLVPALLAADFFVASLVMLIPALDQLFSLLAVERDRSERLLLNVLPASIASRLKEESGTIAEAYEACTVVFADIAGFTEHSRQVSADSLVAELNEIFTAFDSLADRLGVEKIKTIGDGYMAASGVPKPRPDHIEAACEMALGMIHTVGELAGSNQDALNIRIGVHTGPAVGGVIGSSKFTFDLWGDTVNLASRLESSGVVGQVQVSEAVASAVNGKYTIEPAGTKDLKGEGPTPVFLLRR